MFILKHFKFHDPVSTFQTIQQYVCHPLRPKKKEPSFIAVPTLLLLPDAELSLIAERFGLLNDLLLPFLLILDASCPIFYFHLANVLFDVILLSVLGSSLWSFGQGFQIKDLLNCSGIWLAVPTHRVYVFLLLSMYVYSYCFSMYS
jgi:hypothetical protein